MMFSSQSQEAVTFSDESAIFKNICGTLQVVLQPAGGAFTKLDFFKGLIRLKRACNRRHRHDFECTNTAGETTHGASFV